MLKGCSDKTKAFQNWMERDFLFSKAIESQYNNENFKVIINEGTIDLDNMVNEIVTHFEIDLKKWKIKSK